MSNKLVYHEAAAWQPFELPTNAATQDESGEIRSPQSRLLPPAQASQDTWRRL